MYYSKYDFYNCPKCQQKYAILYCASQNSIGAKIYSDGKACGQMLDDRIDILKCRICKNIFWLREINYHSSLPIEKINELPLKNTMHSNSFIDVLKIEDLFEFLKKGHAKKREEEFYVRQHIMWLFNDRIRFDQIMFQNESDEKQWLDNLKKLYALLDDTDENLLLKAEILRNLGDFKSCIKTLERINSEELNWIKENLIEQCKLKNKWVIHLQK